MGDGPTAACAGPGTYDEAVSPDCGHRYRLPSCEQLGRRYEGG
ncbi:hypothetical protein ACFU5Z_32560 [Streptomyces sp. NPDC057521]